MGIPTWYGAAGAIGGTIILVLALGLPYIAYLIRKYDAKKGSKRPSK